MKPLLSLVLCLFVSIPGAWCVSDEQFQQLLERVDTLERQGLEQQGRILHLENQLQQCSCHDTHKGETDSELGIDNEMMEDESTKDVQDNTNSKIKPAESLHRDKPSLHGGNALKRLAMGTEMVAFHALLGASSSHNAVGQTLVFKNSLVNIGGAYNHLTGIFVAPMAGIYIFSTSLGAGNSAEGHNHVDIMKNGVEVGAAYASGSIGLNQGSITILTQLSIGDEVHVSSQRHDNINVFGDKLTSFMGCLIFPL